MSNVQLKTRKHERFRDLMQGLNCYETHTSIRDDIKRAIMDFNGNLLTCCGKTYLRAFLSWIAGMALSIYCITDVQNVVC